MSSCTICRGEYQSAIITYSQEVDGQFVIVEHVRAHVCDQCGDTLLDPDVVERVQQVIWRNVQPTRFVRVPVFDLTSV